MCVRTNFFFSNSMVQNTKNYTKLDITFEIIGII